MMIPGQIPDDEADEARTEARMKLIQTILDQMSPLDLEAVVGRISRRIFVPNWFSEIPRRDEDGRITYLDDKTAQDFREWWGEYMPEEITDLLADEWVPRFFEDQET